MTPLTPQGKNRCSAARERDSNYILGMQAFQLAGELTRPRTPHKRL